MPQDPAQDLNIRSGKGLVQAGNKQIIWNNVKQDIWHHLVSLGQNELRFHPTPTYFC